MDLHVTSPCAPATRLNMALSSLAMVDKYTAM
jgi:hypothetical protein